MKDVNVRAKDQFIILDSLVDFEGKSVANLGCGYNDLSVHIATNNKVKHIFCFEKSFDMYVTAKQRVERIEIFDKVSLPIFTLESDIENTFNKKWPGRSDIGICFSVLPYLGKPEEFLKWMHEFCTVSFLEFQYAKDGPFGMSNIENSAAAAKYLLGIGWDSVILAGSTAVPERDLSRDIWMCTNEPKKKSV